MGAALFVRSVTVMLRPIEPSKLKKPAMFETVWYWPAGKVPGAWARAGATADAVDTIAATTPTASRLIALIEPSNPYATAHPFWARVNCKFRPILKQYEYARRKPRQWARWPATDLSG